MARDQTSDLEDDLRAQGPQEHSSDEDDENQYTKVQLEDIPNEVGGVSPVPPTHWVYPPQGGDIPSEVEAAGELSWEEGCVERVWEEVLSWEERLCRGKRVVSWEEGCVVGRGMCRPTCLGTKVVSREFFRESFVRGLWDIPNEVGGEER